MRLLLLLLSIATFDRKSMCLNLKKNRLSSQYVFEWKIACISTFWDDFSDVIVDK